MVSCYHALVVLCQLLYGTQALLAGLFWARISQIRQQAKARLHQQRVQSHRPSLAGASSMQNS